MSGFLALRQGDINLGKGIMLIGSKDVVVNSRMAARVGDVCTPHPGFGKKIHPFNPLIIGSTKVIVNGRMYGRQTSIELLGHPFITGSTNVIIGF